MSETTRTTTRPADRARRRTPVRPPSRMARRRLDWRWIVAGVSVAAIAGIVAFALWGGASTGGSAGGGAASSVGQVTGPAGGQAATANLPVGTPAPDLTWTLGGKSDSLSGQQGHPVLLEFFATWCPHCQAEAPLITKLSSQYSAQGLRVFGVSSSPLSQDQRSRTSVADIQSYAERYGARFQQLYDPGLVGAQRYGIRGFPTLYVVDKSGVIRFVDSGEVPEATLTSAIASVL